MMAGIPYRKWQTKQQASGLRQTAASVWSKLRGNAQKNPPKLVHPTLSQTLAIHRQRMQAAGFTRKITNKQHVLTSDPPTGTPSGTRTNNPCSCACPGMHSVDGTYPPMTIAFDIDFGTIGCDPISGFLSYGPFIKPKELCPSIGGQTYCDGSDPDHVCTCPPGYHCATTGIHAGIECDPDTPCECWDELDFCCNCDCHYQAGISPDGPCRNGSETYPCEDTDCCHAIESNLSYILMVPIPIGHYPAPCCNLSSLVTCVWGVGVFNAVDIALCPGPTDPDCLDYRVTDPLDPFFNAIAFYPDCDNFPSSVLGCNPCPGCDETEVGCDMAGDPVFPCRPCFASTMTTNPDGSPISDCDAIPACNPPFSATLYGPCGSVMTLSAP